MPLPSSINDLSTTPASNSPAGTENSTQTDDYLRYYAAYIAQLRDGTGFSNSLNITSTVAAFTGNVGVGTTSPTNNGSSYRNIELRGTAGGGGFLYAGDSSTKAQIGYSGAIGGTIVYSLNTDALFFGTNNTERARIDGTGNFITKLQTSAPTLTVNTQMVMALTSDTNLQISVRGSDGTTRTANLTLA